MRSGIGGGGGVGGIVESDGDVVSLLSRDRMYLHGSRERKPSRGRRYI